MKEFESGAKSTEVKPRYDLIPLEALTYIATRLGYGAERHGEHNYKKGVNDPTFIRDRQNHAVEHLFSYINNQTSVDDEGNTDLPKEHLMAAITNLAMLCWLEEHKNENLPF